MATNTNAKLSLTAERQLQIFPRTNYQKDDLNKKIYETFDEQFKLFLYKLPKNNVKVIVEKMFNSKLIYFGYSRTEIKRIFARVVLDKNKLVGIILNPSVLGIDIATGETDAIDSCIYASYYGALRAAMLIYKDDVAKNLPLHK